MTRELVRPKKLRACPIASRELLPGFLQQQLLYSSFSGDPREPSVIEKLINCTKKLNKNKRFFFCTLPASIENVCAEGMHKLMCNPFSLLNAAIFLFFPE